MIDYQLKKAMARLNISPHEQLDWQKNGGIIKEKANFVGEIGQSNAASVLLREAKEAEIPNLIMEDDAPVHTAQEPISPVYCTARTYSSTHLAF